MSELKPCPFCGGVPEYSINMGYADKYVLECECGVKKTSETLEMLNNKWNQRAIPEGYTIVPIVPTENMIKAALDLEFGEFDGVELIYKAMIEASKAEK